jgi:hypothetical protein
VKDDSVSFQRWRDDAADEAKLPVPIELGVFTHLVGTYDGTIITLYLNGAMVIDQPSAKNLLELDEELALGANGSSANEINGVIDEVAIYPAALTPDRVLAHHSAARPIE